MNNHMPSTLAPPLGRASSNKKRLFSLLKALCGAALIGQVSSFAMAAVPPLTVNGNAVLVGGQKVGLEGASLFWSTTGWGAEKFYTPETVKRIKTEFNGNLVRAAIAHRPCDGGCSGGVEDGDANWNANMARLDTVIQAAIDNDMYVIVDLHSHEAANNETNKQFAVKFFEAVARKWGNHNNVIYELYNEPLNRSWDNELKPYAEFIGGKIRAIDPDNLIIMGTPNWSQDVDVASRNKANVSNLAYTIHFYADSHREELRNKVRTALSNGAALFATEWGSAHANGRGTVNRFETMEWVKLLRENGISMAGWAFHDKERDQASGEIETSSFFNTNGSMKESGVIFKEILASRKPIVVGPPPPPPICNAVPVPSKVQAEGYCSEVGTKTESATDTGGGVNVGWVDAGDKLIYKVFVETAGEFQLNLRYASLANGLGLRIDAPMESVNTAAVKTDGWQNWATHKTEKFLLAAGEQEIVLTATNSGFNLNWIEFVPAGVVPPPPPPPPPGNVLPLSVNGNKIMMGSEPTSFAGASFFWSSMGGDRYYNANVVSWLKKDWGVKLVRAAMGVDEGDTKYLTNKEFQKGLVDTVVNAAVANDIYVIIDWHTHHAEDNPNEAVAFFSEMSKKYGHLPNVIYEVYNEPLGNTSWSGTIKPYAVKVINAIRANDPDNLIVVGTRMYSQFVEEAADDRIAGTNIAYTLHYYVGAHGASTRAGAKRALDKGVALFVTEWGIWPPCTFSTPDALPCRGDKNYFDFLTGAEQAEVDAWKNFMVAYHIPSAAWSIADKPEPSSYLYATASTQGNWTDANLTGTGKAVKKMIKEVNGVVTPPPVCVNVTMPGRVQAEAFCSQNGTQTEPTTDVDGGENVGWIDTGDTLTYGVMIPTAGTYTIKYRVASNVNGAFFQLQDQSGSNIYDVVQAAATGGWQNWTTVTKTVNLLAGDQKLVIKATGGGWNINWFELSQGGTPPPPPPPPSEFPCNSGNSVNSGGNPTGVSQGTCVAYTMSPWGTLQLGSWNAPAGVRYDVRNCNGVITKDVAQVQNAFVAVPTGTNGCIHYIHVKQASSPFTLQFGSW